MILGLNMTQTQNQALSQVLETLRLQNNVPALAAAVVQRFIFEPLGMTTCSLGTRFTPLTMPHGHTMQR